MASNIEQETIDFFKDIVQKYEPYPMDIYETMSSYLDGPSHEGDCRYAASIGLRALLDMGYSEDEVNPWKKKEV